MNWVKNNLQLVLGGCAALVLMGTSGWFLAAQIEKEKNAQAQLEREIYNLNSLKNHDPHPGDPSRGIDNIAKVKQEQEKIQREILHPLQEAFKPFALPENLDESAFKILLEEGIASMHQAAQNAGTRLPREKNDSEYSFSFSDIRQDLDFKSETLHPLAFQLAQLESLCQILFDAKIHSIKKIKRPRVEGEDESAKKKDEGYEDDYPESQNPDPYMMFYLEQMMMGNQNNNSSESRPIDLENHYIKETPMTNEITGTILYPFQLRFQCFSRELSDVLSGLNNSDHFFRVKWMAVEQAGGGSQLDSSFPYYGSGAGGVYDPYNTTGRYEYRGVPPAMGMEYGGRLRNVSTAGLEEKPLTINMLVEAISFPPLMGKGEKSETDSAADDISAGKHSESAEL